MPSNGGSVLERNKNYLVLASSAFARRSRRGASDSLVRGWIRTAQRIKVNLDVPADLGRFRRDVETALFRVVQEALTNVHRHSGASEVNIRLDVEDQQVWLEVKDNGKG